MCCCGCSVSGGAKIILIVHLIVCFFLVADAISTHILYRQSLTSGMDFATQMLVAGYSLSGVLLTISALYGVAARVESVVRIYLYFLLLTFLADTSKLCQELIIEQEACSGAGSDNSSHHLGGAALCGVLQIGSYFIIAGVLILELYFLWVVWSLCEDVKANRGGLEFSALMGKGGDVIRKKKKTGGGLFSAAGDPYAGIIGLAHAKVPGPYPSQYGAIDTLGMPSGVTLFSRSEQS